MRLALYVMALGLLGASALGCAGDEPGTEPAGDVMRASTRAAAFPETP